MRCRRMGIISEFTSVYSQTKAKFVCDLCVSENLHCSCTCLVNVCCNFSAQIWSYTCKKISPIKYVDVLFVEDNEDDHNELYLPDVLKGWVPNRRRKCGTARYGTFENNEQTEIRFHDVT